MSYTKKDADQIRAKIVAVVRKGAEVSLDLCWACYETHDGEVEVSRDQVAPLWDLWGYDSWGEYVGIELGLHPTTAYAYRKVWKTFYVDLAGHWDVSKALPITKMRILSAADLSPDNVEKWLDRAATVTCATLVSEVYNTDELHVLSVSVTADVLRMFNRAVNDIRVSQGKEDMPRGEALKRMLKEWNDANRKFERNRRGTLQIKPERT